MDYRLVTLDEIMHNGRLKTYPNGRTEILVASGTCFREEGWEGLGERKTPRECGDTSEAAESLRRAQRRARSAVYDLAHANVFDRFVTFTLDSTMVDRYDVVEITRKLNRWLDNHVRRHGLRYVLVPERHKDGAVHFHGLINSEALAAVDSGTLTRGGKPRRPRSAAERTRLIAEGWQVVYNLPQWTLGFTTAIDLYGDYDAAVGYVCKYISKTTEKVGGRWYYSGGALARPLVTCCDVDFVEFCAEHPDGCWTTKDGGQYCAAVIERGCNYVDRDREAGFSRAV